MKQTQCNSPRVNQTQQQGAVLAVALVFLLVLSLLGVSAMNTTMLETRMARNDQERNYALQTAERGLQIAVANINNDSAVQLIQDGSISSDAAIDIIRDDSNEDLNSIIQNWQITFFGRYPVPRLPANLASSSIEFQAVLFDTQVSAVSNSTETPTMAQLQNGVRQLVPTGNPARN